MAQLVHVSFVVYKYFSLLRVQYTLANPNKGVPIFKRSVPISEFVRISEGVLYSEQAEVFVDHKTHVY